MERIAILKLLVKMKADLEVENANGATPLISACATGFWSAVAILLEAGADVNVRNEGGLSLRGVLRYAWIQVANICACAYVQRAGLRCITQSQTVTCQQARCF